MSSASEKLPGSRPRWARLALAALAEVDHDERLNLSPPLRLRVTLEAEGARETFETPDAG
jgi:hypothetical protein